MNWLRHRQCHRRDWDKRRRDTTPGILSYLILKTTPVSPSWQMSVRCSSQSIFLFMFPPFRYTLTAACAFAFGHASAQDAAAGQTVYMQVCFACHQPTGMGLPGMFPTLAGSDWVTAAKPDRLIRIVLHGITGPIQLNGQPFSSPAPIMPPQGTLSDEQIANVLTYVRTNFGNQASAVTADEVKAIRELEKARTAMWTQAELEKISVN